MKTTILHLTLLAFLGKIRASPVDSNDIENELKSDAENVCIEQKVQDHIINITYIQSQVSPF